MDPKHQLTDSNDYTPSKRAAAAVRTANGDGRGFVDGPNEDSAKPDTGSSRDPMPQSPKNPAGGKTPSENAQHGSDQLGSATGNVSRKPVERSGDV